MITVAFLPIFAVLLTLILTGQFSSAEPDFRTLGQKVSTQPTIRNLKSELIKVDGVEYLVVTNEDWKSVSVCFAMTKNNFKRIGEMVGELEGELSAEKLNRILQNNK